MENKKRQKFIAVRIPETLFRQYKIALASAGDTMQNNLLIAVEKYVDNILDTKDNK